MKKTRNPTPPAAAPEARPRAALLDLDRLQAHAGTLAQVHAMLQPVAAVADGTTRLTPPDVQTVLLARQFIAALHADMAAAVAAVEDGGPAENSEQAAPDTRNLTPDT